MLIVSQDKELIINLSNVIGIQKEEKNIGAVFVNGDSLILGEYKTEKRAKEVLQEIIKKYKGTEALKIAINSLSDEVGALGIERVFVYEMPKE